MSQEAKKTWNATIEDTIVVGIALGVIIVFSLLPLGGTDLRHAYLPTTQGDLKDFYNPYWLRPLFDLLALIPFPLAHLSLMLGSLISLIIATRIFRGRLLHVLLTYQFGALLYYGQVDAIVILGIAIGWWASTRHNPWLVGIGFVLASVKPQISAPALLLLWWWLTPKEKLLSLVVPIAVFLGSIAKYGWWVPEWWDHITVRNTLCRHGSITIWEFVGPWALLLWLPVLPAGLPRQEKLLLFLTTSALTMPYYQQKSILALQTFPIGWIAWLGNIGFLFFFFQWQALELVTLVPLVLYCRYTWKAWRHLWPFRERKSLP